jgi:DNA-binding transcriptional LysR family regulator
MFIMQPEIPYSKLKTFYYVAIHRNFKKAALSLSVTEGAVSHQIKDLEYRLGKRLLERSNKQTTLTPDGTDLFSLIAPIIERLENIVDEFQEKSGVLTGEIRLASFEAMLLHILPTYLDQFRKAFPECEIRLFSVSGRQVRSMVLSGEVDLGIGSMGNLPEKLMGRELWQFDRYIITPLGHPLSKKRKMTIQDVAKYPIVMPDKEGTSGRELDNKLRVHNPNLQVTVEAGSWEVVMKYVELGFGVSVLPAICVNAKDNDRVFLRSSSDILGYSRYGILIKEGKYITPAARALIKFISKDFDFGSFE